MAVKRQQEPRFKFGVQVPRNATHADVLDDVSNSNLWAVSKQKEVESLRAFKTFRALDEGEELPEGYIIIPYHLVFDVKFDS